MVLYCLFRGKGFGYRLGATVQEDPKILLDKYGVGYCLLHKSAAMAWVRPHHPGWRKVYGDDFCKDLMAAFASLMYAICP